MTARLALAAVFATLAATGAFGQPTITVDPEVPSPGQPFRVVVRDSPFLCPVLESAAITGDTIRIGIRYACDCMPHHPLPAKVTAFFEPLPIGRYTVSLTTEQPDLGFCTAGSETFERPLHVASTLGIVSTEIVPAMPTADDEVALVVETLCDLPFAFAFDRIRGDLIEIDPLPPPPVFIDCQPGSDPLSRATASLGRLDPGAKVAAIRRGYPTIAAIELVKLFEVAPGNTEAALTLAERFTVDASWRTLDDRTGEARGEHLAGSDLSGVLWFFRPANTELMVKVLDGCPQNGHYWVFATGLTNLQVDLTVTDTVTGDERRIHNPLGRPFEPVLDTRAFACE